MDIEVKWQDGEGCRLSSRDGANDLKATSQLRKVAEAVAAFHPRKM